MYHLVQFIEDKVYHISRDRHMKKNKGGWITRWYDGYYYKSNLIFSSEYFNTLHSLYVNLQNSYPIVNLRRLDCSMPVGCPTLLNDSPISNAGLNSDDSIHDPDYEYSSGTESDESSGNPVPVQLNDLSLLISVASSSSNIETENVVPQQMNSLPISFTSSSSNIETEIVAVPEQMNSLPISAASGSSNIETENVVPEQMNIQSVVFNMSADHMQIDNVQASSKSKQYFCVFCNKLVTKFARHIQTVHYNETQIQHIFGLPKGSKERLKLIGEIRKQGCFYFNTHNAVNNNQLLVTRRPPLASERKPGDFSVCPNCKGFYSRKTMRRHFLRCYPLATRNEKGLSALSRATFGQILKNANLIMRKDIIPRMRNDDISHAICYDDLAIIYGNKLCLKYRKPHLHYMIRSKLRLIGRLLLAIKKKNPKVTDFASLFQPKFYDDVINGVCQVAFMNEEENSFKSPATAASYGTLLKKCGRILINECIKKNDTEGQSSTKNFLAILEEEFQMDINKTVEENQRERRRQKTVILPNIEDIKKLNLYLNTHRQKSFSDLSEKFNVNVWRNLGEYTLSSIQVFNRRRAGEIERILISDFLVTKTVDEKTDFEIFSSLSDESKKAASQYRRFEIRGKLGRNVPVLLHVDHFKCIKLILKYRNQAGVSNENPYVFGLPGGKNQFLRACQLLRKFSSSCGAENPDTLRGTQLRKHIATRSVLLDLKEQEISDLANFMGHDEQIHKKHYRMPIVTRDIITMSKLLEIAQGEYICHQKDNDKSEGLNGNYVHETENKICSDASLNEIDYDTDLNENGFDTIPNEICTVGGLQDSMSSKTSKKRKRSVSPKGYVKRRSWTTPERNVVTEVFKTYLENQTLPSANMCQNVIQNNLELKDRSPLQIKAFLSNQIQKKKKSVVRRQRRSTMYWTTEEVGVMKNIFDKNIRSQQIPSYSSCTEAISKYPILQNRTRDTVKAWVYNEIQRKQREKNTQ